MVRVVPSSKQLVALTAPIRTTSLQKTRCGIRTQERAPRASVRGTTESPSRFGEDNGVTATSESAILAVGVRGKNLRLAVASDLADGGTQAVFSAIKRSNFAISLRK